MATPTEIQADIDAVTAARRALATGERVDEVWRDGRRLTTGKVTLESLTDLLKVLRQELAEAQADEAGTPRRSSIRFRYGD
ncbi:MAG: phage tail protein [Sphingobium sp.]|nr:MAG: phage tail protein [Sphingobium sp.]